MTESERILHELKSELLDENNMPITENLRECYGVIDLKLINDAVELIERKERMIEKACYQLGEESMCRNCVAEDACCADLPCNVVWRRWLENECK